MDRKLAVWFHKSFSNVPKFKAGPVGPPPDPNQAEKTLSQELDLLRKLIVESATQPQDLMATLDTEIRLRA